MTRQETVVSVKASAVIGIATVVFSSGAAYGINRLQAQHDVENVQSQVTLLQDKADDHEDRIRNMESCVQDIAAIRETVRDVPAMRTDIRWIVYTLERMLEE